MRRRFVQHAMRAFVVARAWLYVRLRGNVPIEICSTGKCWCVNAEQCFFARCRNCDSCVDANGATLDLAFVEEWRRCPYCGGKI